MCFKNDDRIPKKIFKVKRKYLRGRSRTRWNNRLWNLSYTKREECRKKFRRRRCGKIETDGNAWSWDDPPKLEMSEEELGGGAEKKEGGGGGEGGWKEEEIGLFCLATNCYAHYENCPNLPSLNQKEPWWCLLVWFIWKFCLCRTFYILISIRYT